MNALLHFAASYWWLLLIFGGAIASFLEGVRDFFVDTVKQLSGIRHERRMAKLEAQAEVARAREAPAPAAPRPGRCVHRNVVPVVSADEKVVAWLCKSCDTRLPADWAVREEDLT